MTHLLLKRNNWLEAYKFVTKKGNLILSSYARENEPFKLIGKYLVTVHIENINPISKNSFQVEWREDVFAYQESKKSLKYSGFFTTTRITPKEKSDCN
jgi:type IV secretory pathway TrbF-like protein